LHNTTCQADSQTSHAAAAVSRLLDSVEEWSVLHKRMTAPVEELVTMMERYQPMQLPLSQTTGTHRHRLNAATPPLSSLCA